VSDRPAALFDREGVHLQSDVTETVDVLFDGRRVLSLQPLDAQVLEDGYRWLPWPQRLLPFLRGSCEVTLRGHVSGQVMHRDSVAFDGLDLRASVVDEQGHPAAIDKWGRLGRAFEQHGTEERAVLAKYVRQLLDDLNHVVGVPAFAAYGTLLGAVRAGRFIGHDFDADVAYLSQHHHPADLALESFTIHRALVDAGWNVRRVWTGMLHVWVEESGTRWHIDVFTAYFYDGLFNIDRWVEGPMLPEQVTPVGEVRLEGERVAAPADAETVLELTYGPTWRVPDPAFSFRPRAAHLRRTRGWLGMQQWRLGPWMRWYEGEEANQESPAVPPEPSAFAAWVAPQLPSSALVVDAGCGRGRDTRALAARTGHAFGFDYVSEVIDAAQAQAEALGSDAQFEWLNLYDLRQTLATAVALRMLPQQPALYVRNTLNALQSMGRHNLWLMARVMLRGGGLAFVEFFTDERGAGGRSGDPPWRGPLKSALVRREITDRGGVILVDEAGSEPDPRDATGSLHRIIAQW